MGSPASSETIQKKLDPTLAKNVSHTKSEVEELYKSGYRHFIESFNVQNKKVRYYCNKTLSMRQPLYDVLEDLIHIQEKAMAYLFIPPSSTYSLDHYVLSMVFTLIGKTVNMINWKNLNHKCFWEDFCRETRQLRQLVNQAQVANFECVHTVVDKANRAMEILAGITPQVKKISDHRLQETRIQSNNDPTIEGIKMVCMEPNETLYLQWMDAEENEVQSVKLIQTCDSFRLRFLRSLIFYGRKCLREFILTMKKTDIFLRHEVFLEKLRKCEGLMESELLPHEKAALFKAKREFDCVWDDILSTVCRFRMQLEKLQKQGDLLKQLVKNPNFPAVLSPSKQIEFLSVQIDDPLLSRIVGHAIFEEVDDESYEFTVYSDRTEDFIDIVQDLWTTDKTIYRNMGMLTMLIYSALSHLYESCTQSELKELRFNLNGILLQRDRVKKYLKKILSVFNHNAFSEMGIRIPQPESNSMRLSNKPSIAASSRTDISTVEDADSEMGMVAVEGGTTVHWIKLQGGFDVTIGHQKEFLVINQFKDRLQFRELGEEQQVILTNKMIARLLNFVASEACFSRILLDRALETKSLVKRLKQKDRRDKVLLATLSGGLHHVRHMLKLMKTLNALKSFTKRA